MVKNLALKGWIGENMLSFLVLFCMFFPILFLGCLIYLWINTYYLIFFLLVLIVLLLILPSSLRFAKTGVSPTMGLVMLCAVCLTGLLIICGFGILLSLCRFVGIQIFNSVDTYYFMLTSISLSSLTLFNLYYTRKGYFEESMQEKLNSGETTNLLINTPILLVLEFKNLSSNIRFCLLFITSIAKYFFKAEIIFNPIMEAVVLSIAFDTIVKPYCKFVPRKSIRKRNREYKINRINKIRITDDYDTLIKKCGKYGKFINSKYILKIRENSYLIISINNTINGISIVIEKYMKNRYIFDRCDSAYYKWEICDYSWIKYKELKRKCKKREDLLTNILNNLNNDYISYLPYVKKEFNDCEYRCYPMRQKSFNISRQP